MQEFAKNAAFQWRSRRVITALHTVPMATGGNGCSRGSKRNVFQHSAKIYVTFFATKMWGLWNHASSPYFALKSAISEWKCGIFEKNAAPSYSCRLWLIRQEVNLQAIRGCKWQEKTFRLFCLGHSFSTFCVPRHVWNCWITTVLSSIYLYQNYTVIYIYQFITSILMSFSFTFTHQLVSGNVE